MRTGVTSVTFRKLPAGDIIKLAKEARLDGIEWGGDIHAKPGDIGEARRIGDATRAAGLEVLSYGSYFRLTDDEMPCADRIIATAKALGAPRIRVWAGTKEAGLFSEPEIASLIGNIKAFSGMAGAEGLKVATEFHDNTFTSTAKAADQMVRSAGMSNFGTYWQPDFPRRSPEENTEALRLVLPHLHCIHVFQWLGTFERRPLAEGSAQWREWMAMAKGAPGAVDAIMEFVMDDDPARFLADAGTLREEILR